MGIRVFAHHYSSGAANHAISFPSCSDKGCRFLLKCISGRIGVRLLGLFHFLLPHIQVLSKIITFQRGKNVFPPVELSCMYIEVVLGWKDVHFSPPFQLVQLCTDKAKVKRLQADMLKVLPHFKLKSFLI